MWILYIGYETGQNKFIQNKIFRTLWLKMVEFPKPVCGWKQQSQGVSKCRPVCPHGAFARSGKWKLVSVGPVERHRHRHLHRHIT